MNRIAYLKITSFMEIGSIGASHYYGSLVGYNPDYNKIDIEKTKSKADAKKLNSLDRETYHREGQKTSRFETKEEIINIALVEYKNHFPEACILILGNNAKAEPQKILDAPSDILSKGNKMFEESEEIGWIQKHGFWYRPKDKEERIDELCYEWYKLLKEYE